MDQIRRTVASDEYSFLKTNEHLGSNIILLGLGGSHAYGTNTDTSDLDLRGIALNKKQELLTNQNFEQFVNEATDTTIYSFNKIITLLSNCNPNTIEMLGLRPEHYLYLSPVGQEVLDSKKLFLSKKAIRSFGGYANQQLHRLSNKSARLVAQSELEQHILKTIEHAQYDFKEHYLDFGEDDYIKLYIDKSNQPEYDTEVFMDCHMTHYPLRDYAGMWSEMKEIIKSYTKIGKRNEHAIQHEKLGKHMMHLVRLYYMVFDILEREEIVTYREKEHDELMAIRNGKYLNENRQPIPEFFEMIKEFEKRLDYAAKNTSLPDIPNYKKINEFVEDVNERVVKGETKN